MALNIPATVRGCLDKFKALREPEDDEAAEADTYSIKNELDRFKIWVGNLAAHRPMGKRSLEYRLRDSNDLRSQVLELLNDLSNALDCYADPPAGRGNESAASESDDELLDFEYDDLATQPPNALQDIHDTINLLYQFAGTLRNPAGHNRIKAGVTSMRPYYSEIYVNHVRDKFPDAAQYLVDRLGGAISSRRQYFKYREEHTSKMNAGLEDLDDGRTTTIASSLPKVVEYVTDIEETETTYSMTSYAPTESETSKLRPPPLPKTGCDGDPFECPICYSMVQVSGETMWKQHVFEDLAPYVCTREDCRLGNKLYTRRRDWQRHQTQMHDRIWVCPLGCGSEYDSSEDVNSHLAKKHGHTNQGGRFTRMAYASSRQTDAPFDLQCPLCRKVNASTTLWFKHVGKHLEQLALQAIDPHKLATESDDESISGPGMDRISEEDAPSHGSSNNNDRAGSPVSNRDPSVPESREEHLKAIEQQRQTQAADIEAYLDPAHLPADSDSRPAAGPGRETSSPGYSGSLQRSRSLGHGPAPTINIYNTRPDAEENSSNAPSETRGPELFWEDVSKNLASSSNETRDREDSTSSRGWRNSVEGDAWLRQERQRQTENEILDEAAVKAAAADSHGGAVEKSARGDKPELKSWRDDLDNERKSRDAKDQKEAEEMRWRDEYGRKNLEAADRAKAEEQALKDRLESESKEEEDSDAAAPRWRDTRESNTTTRPRRGSMDRGGATSRERPVSVLDPTFGARPGTKEIGPPPSTRGWDKINEDLGRTRSVRDESRAAQSPTRGRTNQGTGAYGDPRDQYYVPPRTKSTDRYKAFKQKERDEKDAKERKYQEFLREQKDRDGAAYKAFKQNEQDTRQAEEAFQAQMRQRLQALGYTDKTIDIMVDEEKAKKFKSAVEGQSSRADIHQAPRAPVYPKVHRDYLAIETLKYYDLPWQYDSNDPDYIIIMRDMEKRETDLLFEHTSRLRAGKTFSSLRNNPRRSLYDTVGD